MSSSYCASVRFSPPHLSDALSPCPQTPGVSPPSSGQVMAGSRPAGEPALRAEDQPRAGPAARRNSLAQDQPRAGPASRKNSLAEDQPRRSAAVCVASVSRGGFLTSLAESRSSIVSAASLEHATSERATMPSRGATPLLLLLFFFCCLPNAEQADRPAASKQEAGARRSLEEGPIAPEPGPTFWRL